MTATHTPTAITAALHALSSADMILALETGDDVTIWPTLPHGASYDNEPGAQPWKAEFVGWTTDGRLIVKTGDAKYATGEFRIFDATALSPDRSPKGVPVSHA
jgi:hypothetical protein